MGLRLISGVLRLGRVSAYRGCIAPVDSLDRAAAYRWRITPLQGWSFAAVWGLTNLDCGVFWGGGCGRD